MSKIKRKYPPPDYNPRSDGRVNPAEIIIDFNLNLSKKKLRKLCYKHALETTGSKRALMKRLYLHWRASKLRYGFEYYGYGRGYENTRKPTCSCGFLNKEEMLRRYNLERDKRDLRQEQNYKLREIPLWKFGLDIKIYRFPRLLDGEPHRYPRL